MDIGTFYALFSVWLYAIDARSGLVVVLLALPSADIGSHESKPHRPADLRT